MGTGSAVQLTALSNRLEVRDAAAAFQEIYAADPTTDDALATKRYVDTAVVGGDLSAVLGVGNTTGGSDIIISTGDVIQGQTAVQIEGAYSSGPWDGLVTIKGGDIAGNGTNLSSTDTVIIHGADAVDAPASPSSSSYGGRVLIRGGFSGYTRPCGSVTVRGGEALDSPVGATYGTVEGGDVTVRGGNGLGNRAGGTLTLKSGDAGGTSGTGGVVLALRLPVVAVGALGRGEHAIEKGVAVLAAETLNAVNK